MHQEQLEHSKEVMITLGRTLMKERGVTHAEISLMMVSILTVCQAMISAEIEILLQQVAATVEAEHSTKQ